MEESTSIPVAAQSKGKGPAFTSSLLAGAASGLSVDFLFYPIDTLKTRLQSSQGFFAAGGFSGIYKGLGSVAVGSAPGAATFFVTYESLKPFLASSALSNFFETSPAALHMLSASMAETAACLIRVPTEVIKSRQQTSSYGAKVSTWQAFQAVGKEAGWKGYYRGFASTVSREIPFTCIQFPLYEHFKHVFANRRRSLQNPSSALPSSASSRGDLLGSEVALAGSCAGSIAAALTTPLDVAKTRIMLHREGKTNITQEALQRGVNTKIVPTLRHVFANEGAGALFSGVVPRTLWIGLGGAVFLGTFELGLSVIEPQAR